MLPRPSYATVLYAQDAPDEGAGGETEFADTAAAYAALSKDEQARLETLFVTSHS
jgi:alpha-ketoglutarate-dependent taurine dioxygenase